MVRCLRTPIHLPLFDLTSTHFEALAEGNPGAVRGYSRDHRADSVQIVIGLVVTRSGLSLGYQELHGNRGDATTLGVMAKMESLYGKASRIWMFDRGVASEKNLEALRACGGNDLVGTSRSLLRKVERALLKKNWATVRDGVEVKLVTAFDGSSDTFILCRSAEGRAKEAAIHDRFYKKIQEGLTRLAQAVETRRLQRRDALQQRLGPLKMECSRVARAYRIDGHGEDGSQ